MCVCVCQSMTKQQEVLWRSSYCRILGSSETGRLSFPPSLSFATSHTGFIL